MVANRSVAFSLSSRGRYCCHGVASHDQRVVDHIVQVRVPGSLKASRLYTRFFFLVTKYWTCSKEGNCFIAAYPQPQAKQGGNEIIPTRKHVEAGRSGQIISSSSASPAFSVCQLGLCLQSGGGCSPPCSAAPIKAADLRGIIKE